MPGPPKNGICCISERKPAAEQYVLVGKCKFVGWGPLVSPQGMQSGATWGDPGSLLGAIPINRGDPEQVKVSSRTVGERHRGRLGSLPGAIPINRGDPE